MYKRNMERNCTMKQIVMAWAFLGVFALTSTAQTTYELLFEADSTYKSADAELNAVYKALVATLNPGQKESLKLAERAWISYRDACTASEAAIYAGGSIEGVVAINAAVALTIEQTKLLKGLLAQSPKTDKNSKDSSCEEVEKEMQKIYAVADADDGTLEKAQTAWTKYRDLFLVAASALQGESEKDAFCKKLTTLRIARLKELFPEGYPGDAG